MSGSIAAAQEFREISDDMSCSFPRRKAASFFLFLILYFSFIFP